MGLSAGMLDDSHLGDDEEEGLDDLHFTDEEIEEAMGSSPLDDLEGRQTEDDASDGTPEDGKEGEGESEQGSPDRINPRTGQLRREDGTFGSEVVPKPQPQSTPTDAPPSPADAGEQQGGTAATEQGEPPAPPEPAPIEESPAEPVRYRSNGRTYEIAGSRATEDGIFIPKEAQEETLLLLNRGRHFDTYHAQTQRELQQLRTARAEAEVKFTAYAEHFMELARAARDGDEEAADKLQRWVDDIVVNLPVLEAKAERAAMEHERMLMQQGIAGEHQQPAPGAQPQSSDVDEREIERVVREALPKAMELAREVPAYMGVSDDAVQAAMRLIDSQGLWSRYFVVADRDYPERGIQAGQVLADKEALGKLAMEQHALLVQQARRAQDAAQAAQRNQRRTGAPAPGSRAAAGQVTPGSGSRSADGHVPPLPASNDREAYEKWSRLPMAVREASSKQGRRAPKGGWRIDG